MLLSFYVPHFQYCLLELHANFIILSIRVAVQGFFGWKLSSRIVKFNDVNIQYYTNIALVNPDIKH